MNKSADEESVKEYCLHHELARPPVNHLKAIAFVGLLLLAGSVTAYALSRLACLDFWISLDLCTGIAALCSAKHILVFLVLCYQHYAPESLRRQCSCKPSCSEYALLALDKYVWPKALWKIWRRVTYTCIQPGYHFDNL